MGSIDLRALDKHAGSLSEDAIEQFLRDVYLYTTKTGVRDAIDEIVRAKLTERPTVVVRTHSGRLWHTTYCGRMPEISISRFL